MERAHVNVLVIEYVPSSDIGVKNERNAIHRSVAAGLLLIFQNATESLEVARSRTEARAWRAAVAKGRGPHRRGSSHDAQQSAHRCACHARL